MNKLRLEIAPVIEQAENLHRRILAELPGHEGLASITEATVQTARTAERVARHLRRPIGLHRLPALFLAVALCFLGAWIYVTFFRTSELSIALPDRDAQGLRARVSQDRRVEFRPVVVQGSREAILEVSRGRVDLAFVQGGFPIPPELPRLTTPNPELVLWFVRAEVENVSDVRRVMTSVAGEGSHTVAQAFMDAWGIAKQVEFVHEWDQLKDRAEYVIPAEVQAVFVVKDPADEATLQAAARLIGEGFELVSPDLGARAGKHPYLSSYEIPQGYFHSTLHIPNQPVGTYSVATYLVARQGLTPRLLATASHLLDGITPTISAGSFEPNMREASEILQGIEAFLGILINIGLAFLALLGWEILAYRKRFHELNSLISLISVHQSSKDVLGVTDPTVRRENLLYLGLCSDLLGLVSMIAGYYTQENSSLLFNSLPEIIHQRCDGLKINLQLKILHAMVDSEAVGEDPVARNDSSVSPSPPMDRETAVESG